MDPSVGLSYYDLSCVPPEVVAKFSFLKQDRTSICFPRIYSVSIASEITPGATDPEATDATKSTAMTAASRVVVLTLDSLIIGDLETGQVAHNVKIATDIMAAFTVQNEPSWLGIITNGSVAGGDILLQSPVSKDAEDLQKGLQALYYFHSQKHLTLQTTQSETDIRNRVFLKPMPAADEYFSLSNVVIPKQLWSVANLSTPIITDRMGHVKGTLLEVENETKGAMAAASQDLDAAQSEIDANVSKARSSMQVKSKELARQLSLKQSLDEQENELYQTREKTEAKERECDALRVEFATGQQEWQEIAHSRYDEERVQKQKLVKQQSTTNKTINQQQEDIEAIRQEIEELGLKLWAFDSEEYGELVAQRDGAIANLKIKTSELEELQSEKAEFNKNKLDKVSQDMLATNEALRKLLTKTRDEADAEAAKHEDLRKDVNMLLEDIAIFEDQELIYRAKERELEVRVRVAKSDVERLDHHSAAMQEDIEARQQHRKFYLVERNKTTSAIERRRATERTSQAQRTAQLQQRMDLQQEMFAEKLRLDAELKRRPPPL